MLLQKTMRYYRLWIYAFNVMHLAAVLVFVIYAIHIIRHPWLQLLPTLSPYHPAMMYGYVAIILQAGVLQVIGFIGARSLSKELLTIYLRITVGLLIGDLVVGVIFIFSYVHISSGVISHVKGNLQSEYLVDPGITKTWDRLQIESHCCGAVGWADYNSTWWDGYNASSGEFELPNSCCSSKPSEDLIINIVVESPRFRRHSIIQANILCSQEKEVPYNDGCAQHLEKWLFKSAENLMLLGFFVISFIKLCFLGFLRIEIQEMLDKIVNLQEELLQDLSHPQLGSEVCITSNSSEAVKNNNIKNEHSQNIIREPSINNSYDTLYLRDDRSPSPKPLYQSRMNHLSVSDNNIRCETVIDNRWHTLPPKPPPRHEKRKHNSNNNSQRTIEIQTQNS